MVRACRPPARARSGSGAARRSTMTTSTWATASSAASIIPVGPPPAITTACLAIFGYSFAFVAGHPVEQVAVFTLKDDLMTEPPCPTAVSPGPRCSDGPPVKRDVSKIIVLAVQTWLTHTEIALPVTGQCGLNTTHGRRSWLLRRSVHGSAQRAGGAARRRRRRRLCRGLRRRRARRGRLGRLRGRGPHGTVAAGHDHE